MRDGPKKHWEGSKDVKREEKTTNIECVSEHVIN